jgi:hypothetical protein
MRWRRSTAATSSPAPDISVELERRGIAAAEFAARATRRRSATISVDQMRRWLVEYDFALVVDGGLLVRRRSRSSSPRRLTTNSDGRPPVGRTGLFVGREAS